VVGDAAVFHTLVCNLGVEFLKGELGRLLSYVFFHKDGEFVCCIRLRIHAMIEFCVDLRGGGDYRSLFGSAGISRDRPSCINY